MCQGRRPPSGLVCNHVSYFVSLHLSHFVSFHLCVRGGVRLLDWSAISCLPLSPFNSLPLSRFICVSGAVSAFWTGLQLVVSLCLPSIVSLCLVSSVCQGRCPPSGLVCNHLSPFESLHLSPFVSFNLCVRGGIRFLDWSAIISLPLCPLICLLLSPFIPQTVFVGVLNSILKCVHLVSGVVSAFWTGLPSYVSLCFPSSVCQALVCVSEICVPGDVRLCGLCVLFLTPWILCPFICLSILLF